MSTSAPSSSSTLTANTDLMPPKMPEPSLSEMPILQAVNAAALMERTPFAIDDAKDDEEEYDDLGGDDDQVMDEVCRIQHMNLASDPTHLVFLG